MSYTTIQQISDGMEIHSVRITAAQSDADFAQTEAARALTTIYGVGLDAQTYTDAQIQLLRDSLRVEFQNADDQKRDEMLLAIEGDISATLPSLLNSYYGNYSGIEALYQGLLTRFGQSDAALDHLLNSVIPGLAQNVDNASLTATTVAQDFGALEQSLKSVLIVFAADAAGNNQSLTAGTREYVRYVEYNGTPPTLPVTGSFTKFVGTAQSVWPIYASTSTGNDQSFEPGARQYVTFYESPVAPDLPVAGQTFVKYVGSNGTSGDRGSGIWHVPVTTLPTTASTSAQNKWNAAVTAGQDIPVRPKIQDQVYFYTGTAGNPTGQRVFICQWVTSDTSHGWDWQENVMRGDLLVPGTVTSNEINSRGLSIKDEYGNVILQATGGSAGINLNKVVGAGAFAGVSQINKANISTFIAGAAIGTAYIDNLAVSTLKIGNNAVTVPLAGTGILRTGANVWQSAVSMNLVLPYPGNVLCLWNFAQGYLSGPGPTWGVELFLNGSSVFLRENMGAINDYPTGMLMIRNLSAGQNIFSLYWKGSNNQIVSKGSMVLLGTMK